MAAAVYESEGWAIDIDAVKEQLRLLGHDVSDDVIVQFIKDVYIPQRAAADAAGGPGPVPQPGPPPPSHPSAPVETAATARPHATATASLALAAAVESGDHVVLSTDEEAFDLPRSSVDQLRHGLAQHRPSKAAAPIDIRGDSASDWNDDFGLKDLKISSTAHGLTQDKAAEAAPQTAPMDAASAAGLVPKAASQRTALPPKAAQPAALSTSSLLFQPHTSDTVSPRDTQNYSSASTLPPAPQQQHPQHVGNIPPAPKPTRTAAQPNPQTPLSAFLASASDASKSRSSDQGTTQERPLSKSHDKPPVTAVEHNTYSFLPRTQPARHIAAPTVPANRTGPLVSDWPTDLLNAAPPRCTQPASMPVQQTERTRTHTRSTAAPVQPVVHPYSFLADASWLESPTALADTYPRQSSPMAERPEARHDVAHVPRDSRTEGSISSFSTRSATSSVRSSASGRKKVDRVNRYHELAAGWEKDRFLKRNASKPKQAFNFHTYFAALHESEAHQQQQRKQAARAKTRKALAPAASYQVPTEKRRDSLRWEVRMQMRRPADLAEL